MPLFVFAASQVIAQKRGANLGHPSEEKERHTEFGLQAWQLRYCAKGPASPRSDFGRGSNAR